MKRDIKDIEEHSDSPIEKKAKRLEVKSSKTVKQLIRS